MRRSRITRARKGAPAVLLAALLAGSCVSLEPQLELPPPPIAGAWPIPPTTALAPVEAPAGDATAVAGDEAAAGAPAAAADAGGRAAAADVGWRDFFVDERLEQLIALALQNNRDLRLAVLDVERARALHDIQRAERVPWVDGSASALRQRLSASETGGDAATVSAYNLQVGVTSYELDLFGRVRSLSHAALERFFATEEARRGAQLSLIASVADAYLGLAADRELQRLAEGTVKSEEESFRLTQRRYELGAVSGLEASQARTTVERARVDAIRYEGQVEQDLNLLTLLIGGPVDPALLPAGFDESVSAAAALPIGLPSEALLRRPDVLQAEHFLRAANADVGAARAAFFPRITLTGSAGYASADLDELFSGGAGIWTFLPRVTVPIFQGGRLRAGRRVAEVDRQAAVTEYERAIQIGFREVSDALIRARSLARQRAAQAALTEAAGRAYELSRARYDSGRDSYLLALDSQRSHYFAQQGLIVLRLAEELNRVELYRSVGGGWRENSE
ncbi:MAG TPA: efflux transporter outer membrane subunit [Thermoanaerobaculia bacterium]|nr:efflux transporter outer membrane subunit [Thermoanaerobaculia bacterium]